MKRHPKVEHPEMRFEPLGIDSSSVQRDLQVGTTMKPLTAGGHFESAQ